MKKKSDAISKELVAYPVYFKKNGNGYTAFNDKIPFVTEGRSKEETILMAKDAIELMAYDCMIDGESFISAKESEGTDDIYDFMSYVLCDLNKYFKLETEEKVKKNCTIPKSLAKAGENRGINFSQVLTYALENELEIY